MTRFSRLSGCTPLCSALALRRGRTHVLGGSPSGSVADARSRALLSFALFRLPIWRVLERRGVAEPLVYSSTRHSAKVLYQVYSRLLFL